MHRKRICCAGGTAAIRYAAEFLQDMDFCVTREAGWDTAHLLLDVPSFRDDTMLRTGGSIDTLLGSMPKDITIWGGNLGHPAVEGYHTMDLLKDDAYLAKNAAITADCTLQVAAPLLTATWQESPALVIGWGRIGKCLSKLLKDMGNDVTIAARDSKVRSALEAMGYRAVDPRDISKKASRYRILFNTAPEAVITEADAVHWQNCIKIDLASRKGIAGEDVVWARGLPGIHAPESSGRLIAETIARIWKERNL